MSSSPLVSYTALSPNNSGRRTHAIDTITIHHMAGNLSVESCGAVFAPRSRKASSNYGIGSDGRIGLYVDEDNRAWTTSSSANDNRAVTIEVANCKCAEPWPVSDEAYKALIDLLEDICRRRGIKRLLWLGDKSLIGQVSRQNMTAHRWFAATNCPGDYLYSRFGQIADEVNSRLNSQEDEDMDVNRFSELFLEMRGELQDNEAGDYSAEARQWAVSSGLIQGGGTMENGEPNYMWRDLLTREQMATLLYRFAQMLGKA